MHSLKIRDGDDQVPEAASLTRHTILFVLPLRKTQLVLRPLGESAHLIGSCERLRRMVEGLLRRDFYGGGCFLDLVSRRHLK